MNFEVFTCHTSRSTLFCHTIRRRGRNSEINEESDWKKGRDNAGGGNKKTTGPANGLGEENPPQFSSRARWPGNRVPVIFTG
jgi:hypothetical protein